MADADVRCDVGTSAVLDGLNKTLIQHCENAVDDIKSVLSDLKHDMESTKRLRRHGARVKLVMKKKKVQDCFCRLERAKSTLALASQFYIQSVGI